MGNTVGKASTKLSTDEATRLIQSVVRYSTESVSGLVWTESINSRARKDAPALAAKDGRGYCNGFYKYTNLKAHRVVWFLHHGTLPECVDHIDGDRTNNRIENLRAVSSAQNTTNQLGRGYTVVGGKYRAQISIQGTTFVLGTFSTPERARAEYLRAKRVHHVLSTTRVNKQ
ncbi:HNH endonuclease [Pectobacterium phage PPWS2]|uniref:HNH endonuclease n=1 Tax=Pectobacterium phage PPWS2 TaxID=2153295 RepID=A0A3G9EJ69_9CAUD|nr:HNH endonuclease [Pectobacterium phage PPWS2]BBD74633.1 HNH endonuclease [Pectobacterium phage PPWS2]